MKYLLFGFLALWSVVYGETLHIVKDGKMTDHAITQGDSWQELDGRVVGERLGQNLLFLHAVEAGDFEVEVNMKLDKLGHTASAISFGKELFGFDGATGLFVEGGEFPQTFFKNTFIEAGKDFTFKAIASKGMISFLIDEKEVTKRPFRAKVIDSLFLRPHRSKVFIKNFSVKGNFTKCDKLTHIYKSGTEGYHTFRIPALTTSKKGTLLAFAEGRVNNSGSYGDIDIVLKRSLDNGKTWQKMQVVTADGELQCSNPVPIVDQKSGKIFLLSCGSDSTESEVMAAKSTREVYIQHSDDDGVTWSERRKISEMVKKENWRWYATGPCSGIQIREGKNKGRLVTPANHSVYEKSRHIYRAHNIYSDDLGETWHIGQESANGGNESVIAEAQKDVLYQSIRMQTHGQGMRGTRYSNDAGKTWTTTEHDGYLQDPTCQASVIRDYSRKSRLIFSNPAAYKERAALTVRLSDDAGKTWPYRKTIFLKSSAYSSLSLSNEGQLGILYEAGYKHYLSEGIAFKSLRMDEVWAKEPAITEQPKDKKDWKLWNDRFEQFNTRAKEGNIDLLLLGDSITHYWQKNKMSRVDGQKIWNKEFNEKVANFGIGSDRTQHLLYRLKNGNLENIQPKAIVLMIGTNNTTSGHSAYDIYLGTKAIVEEIKQKCPETKILLYNIFPRSRGKKAAWDNNKRANKLCEKLCDGRTVIHCSINAQLLDRRGRPNKVIFHDGLHVNKNGYRIWAKDIKKNLENLNISL